MGFYPIFLFLLVSTGGSVGKETAMWSWLYPAQCDMWYRVLPSEKSTLLKNRCIGKGPCGFDSFEFFLLHYKLFFFAGGHLFIIIYSQNLLFKMHVSCKQSLKMKRKFYQAMNFALHIWPKFFSHSKSMLLRTFITPYTFHIPETVKSFHCCFPSSWNNPNSLKLPQSFSFQCISAIFLKLSNTRIQY